MLPIFLEEAAELFPQAGEQLRAWRHSAPPTRQSSSQLRRTLHTFKGSARMAGAMRLGELTHRMESRLDVGGVPAPATPALFDALDDDLDRIAFVLEALREGKINVALPWNGSRRAGDKAATTAVPPPAIAPVEPAAAREPIAAKPIVVPLPPVVPVAPAAPITPAAPVAAAAPAAEAETGQRAQLRVRADMIDRLVNEAGEVAIARARVEGELRSLKSNLLELTGSA